MDKLQEALIWISTANIDDLRNIDTLSYWIGHAGLFFDSRKSPHDPLVSIYGDDVKYMLDSTGKGMWQTPCQLSPFLITLSYKNIKTYLDIGTLTGWTITFIAAYLKRFGLEAVDAIDIDQFCNSETQDIWQQFEIPINYIVCKSSDIEKNISDMYDFIFIDGNHEYANVKEDFQRYGQRTCMMAFHDINDHFCTGVVRLWNEIKLVYRSTYSFTEFIDHPNKYMLMGIGLVEKPYF
uniref:Methyltransferase n=1 Tax=viral metagenome TaxID=1070528 RepID=A0A6C0BEI3_9ZZZZ